MRSSANRTSLLLFILSILIVLEHKSGLYLAKLCSNTEPMTSNFATYLKFVLCKHRNICGLQPLPKAFSERLCVNSTFLYLALLAIKDQIIAEWSKGIHWEREVGTISAFQDEAQMKRLGVTLLLLCLLMFVSLVHKVKVSLQKQKPLLKETLEHWKDTVIKAELSRNMGISVLCSFLHLEALFPILPALDPQSQPGMDNQGQVWTHVPPMHSSSVVPTLQLQHRTSSKARLCSFTSGRENLLGSDPTSWASLMWAHLHSVT